MRTVPSLRQGRTAARLGAPVALVVTLGLLAAGCGTTDGDEPDPGAAPSVVTGEPRQTEPTPSDDTSPTPSDDAPAPPSAAPDDGDDTDGGNGTGDGADEPDGTGDAGDGDDDAADGSGDSGDPDSPDEGGKPEKPGKSEKEKKAAAAAAQERREQEERERKEQERRDAMPRYGDSGERVVALQSRLAELGYFLQDVDGQFGPATQQAVWALQKAAGLSRDGVVGPRTKAALDAGTRPSARTSSGRAVEIDLDRQLLMTVEDGRVTRIINASSGNGEQYQARGRTYTASTPRGSYSVYMERNYLHESTLELGSMWRPKYFSGGYAVHGSGSIPPYPASHGCVRVSNAAMNWLWDSWGMPKGTPVVLY